MPISDLSIFCDVLESTKLCITLPGGAILQPTFPDLRVPDPAELVNQLLGMLSSALAPLQPIFDIIDVLIAIVNCIQAILKAISSFPPRIDLIIKCLVVLVKKLGKLLKIIPVFSIPAMVAGILDTLIVLLQGIRKTMLAILSKSLKISLAQAKAARLGSSALALIAGCAQNDVDKWMDNLADNMKPLSRLLELINCFLCLANLKPLPTSLSFGVDASGAIAPIDFLIDLLSNIRLAFPFGCSDDPIDCCTPVDAS